MGRVCMTGGARQRASTEGAQGGREGRGRLAEGGLGRIRSSRTTRGWSSASSARPRSGTAASLGCGSSRWSCPTAAMASASSCCTTAGRRRGRARWAHLPGEAVPRCHGPHEPGDSRRQAGGGRGPRALRRARAAGGDGPRGGAARVRWPRPAPSASPTRPRASTWRTACGRVTRVPTRTSSWTWSGYPARRARRGARGARPGRQDHHRRARGRRAGARGGGLVTKSDPRTQCPPVAASLVLPRRFERLTCGLEDRCSIQLS